MKTIYQLLLFVLIYINGNAQENIVEIYFNNGSANIIGLENLESLKKGDLYKVKITNINMNRYNVSINKKDSVFVSEIEFPTFEMIGLGSITDIISSLTTITHAVKGKGKEIAEERSQIDKRLNFTNYQIAQLNDDKNAIENQEWKYVNPNFKDWVLTNPNLVNMMSESEENYFSPSNNTILIDQENLQLWLSNLINSKLDSISNQYIELIQYRNDIDLKIAQLSLKEQIMGKIASSTEEIKSQLSNIETIVYDIDNFIIPGLELTALSYQESNTSMPSQSILGDFTPPPPKDLLKKLHTHRTNLKASIGSIVDINNQYESFKGNSSYKPFYKNDNEIKKLDSLLLKEFSTTKRAIDSALVKISNSVVSKFLSTIIDLDNNKDRNYISLPLQHNGDKGKLSITITPKKPEYGPSFSTEIEFPQRKRVYVGLGMSFYYANLKNETYSTQGIAVNDSTIHYQVVSENSKKGELGLTALIHFGIRPFSYSRTWDFLGINFVTGPALSLTNPVRPRLAIGGGLSFGNKNMLSVDFMYMGGFTNKISNVYNLNDTYGARPENVTVTNLSGAFSIAIGYIYKF